MGRQRNDELRVLGPYEDRSKDLWRLVIIKPGGERRQVTYATRAEAERDKAEALGEIKSARETNIEQALALYEEQHLKAVKLNKPGSAYATMFRLKAYFEPVMKVPVSALSEKLTRELREGKWRVVPGKAKAEIVMHGLATRPLKRTKKPATATSQLNTIAAARTFTRWLLSKGLIKSDPMVWFDPHMEPERVHGGKGRSKLSFSQAERVLLLSLEIAEREAGKTDIGNRAAAVFITLMTGLRATTIANLRVGNVDRRRGEAEGERWILTAPQAKKRGKTVDRPYGLTAPFERVLGPLCAGRPGDAPLFPTARPMSAAEKAALAARYSDLDQSKTKEATAARRSFLLEHGTWRQQINKWQRGDFAADEEPRRRGHHGRDWVRRSVAKLCVLAGVPTETAHGLRGALATKLTADGYADVAQWLLNHVHASTTANSYASPESVTLGKSRQFMSILAGGKR